MVSKNIYLIYGDDAFAIEEFEKKFITQKVDPEWETFNLDIIDPLSSSVDKIIESANSPPFGFGDKLTIVRKAENVFNQNEDYLKELTELIKKGLMDTNFLIFSTQSVDKRKSFTKFLLSAVEIKELNQPSSWDIEKKMVPWVEDYFRKNGKVIEFVASKELVQATSGNKQRLEREIEKLLIYVGENHSITYKDVRTLVTNTESDLFELIEFMAKKETGNALRELNNLLTKENPIKFIASLTSNLKTAYSIKLLQEDEKGTNDICKILGQRPFIVEKSIRQWKLFNSKRMRDIMKDLMDIDLMFKSQAVNQKMELEKFTVKHF